MKKKINTRVFAAVALLPLFQASSATAVNDGLFFDLGLRGDVEGSGNAAGRADLNEVGNLMTVGKAGGWDKVTHGLPTKTPGQDPVKFETVKVPSGYWQLSAVTNEISVLKFSQSTVYGTDGTYSNSQQTVRLSDTNPNVHVRSGLIRFRWDGFAFTNKAEAIIFGDCWSYQHDKGFAFYINADSSRLAVWNGNKNKTCANVFLEPNQWYDLVFRFGDGPDGKAIMKYAWATNSVVKWGELQFDNEVDMDATANNLTLNRITLGGQENNEDVWLEYSNTGNRRKAFKGAFANVKLWNRLMSDEELLAVLAGQDGMQWSIGAKNGSADEFGGNPQEEFDPAVDSWSKMKKSLAGSDNTLTLRTKMGVSDVGLQKSLRVIPLLSSGATGDVRLSVNGVDVESACLGNGKEHVFVIPAGMWSADEEGYVTVALTRTGTVAGTLSFDALSMSGGWQIGYADEKTGEFPNNESSAPTDFFIGDTDISNHVRRAVYSKSSGSINKLALHFWVDERMAKNAAAVYSTKISSWQSKTKPDITEEPIEVHLNGNRIHQAIIKLNENITVPIARETMNAGLNTIEFCNLSTNVNLWMKQDYFRLEFKREYSPFTFLVR